MNRENIEINYTWILCSEEEEHLLRELEQELNVTSDSQKESVKVTVKRRKKGLRVETDGTSAVLEYHKKCELSRGIGILTQKLREKEYSVSEEEPVFDSLTFMQDNSRNGVCNIASVKKLLRQISLMGYSSMQLYTEDTYEIIEYPFFGYMRGRYTKEELKELNDYGLVLGVELIPCIQTLAHLNAIFQWSYFGEIRDTGDILLCKEEKTYELIEAMIKTSRECFTSKKINIGMDEAEMLGRGKYLDRFSYEKRFDIMTKHLERVLDLCKKYDFDAMMWSDMFFKMLSGGSYHATDITISEDVKKQIPEEVSLVYWDYYSREEETYDKMLKKHKEMSERIVFAGGAWRWNGFAPLLHHSLLCGTLALPSCVKNGVKDVIVTAWGDNGSECSVFSTLPVLLQYAEFNYTSNLEEQHLAERLWTCTGMIYEDMMLLDLPNLTPDNPSPGRVSVGPAKYLFYQDLLIGLYDLHIDEETYPAHFKTVRKQLEEAGKRAGEYQYMFQTLERLCEVLEVKSVLGIHLKQAYDQKDSHRLLELTLQCKDLLNKIEEFHIGLQTQWYRENKAFGFEVLDIRIGGVKERVNRTIWSIESYIKGDLDKIEELEQKRLLLDTRENPPYRTLPLYHNQWADMVSSSVI